MTSGIHPTAIIDASSEIGPDVEIGPFVVIGPRVRIGAGSRLMHHASIIANTELGERNVVYPGTVLGADPQDKKFAGEETWLRIGNDNTLREMVTVHRGTGLGGGETRVGNGCLLMASCHVAHDCILGNEIVIANDVLLGGHVVVEDRAGFGGSSAVHHFVSVGRCAFVGGMTRLNRDAPPYLISEGNPVRVRAVNRVGMTRNGLTEDVVHWMKEAQRLLFVEGKSRDEAMQELESIGVIPEQGRELWEFLAQIELGKQGRARQP